MSSVPKQPGIAHDNDAPNLLKAHYPPPQVPIFPPTRHGSPPQTFKIRRKIGFCPPLAAALPSSRVGSEMKRPARPLFSILLLAAFAATLTCRAFLRRGLSPFDLEAGRKHLPPPVFNSTLLKLAETDLGEPKFKQDTENLLEGNFAGQSWRYRNFAPMRR
ncbi:hypothetical protein CRG98_025914, partial [Punica granatum]